MASSRHGILLAIGSAGFFFAAAELACRLVLSPAEYQDIQYGLKFDPDLVLLQFDLNDVVEPYLARQRRGGYGDDYHGVRGNPSQRFLASHSALYLVLEESLRRVRWGALTRAQMKGRLLREAQQLHWAAAADPPQTDEVREAWQDCLSWLQAADDLCAERDVPLLLMASFHDFQLLQPQRRFAQEQVKNFAMENGIEYLDLLPWMENLLYERLVAEGKFANGSSFAEIRTSHPDYVVRIADEYFLDYGHFSVQGHRALARHLSERLAHRISGKARLDRVSPRSVGIRGS